MLSIEDEKISNAFLEIEAKITELQERLKCIDKVEKYAHLRNQNRDKFEARLNEVELAISQVNSAETLTLKRNAEAIQELNKKCKTLLDNVSLLLQQQGSIAQSDSLHSRLSNTFFPTENCNSDFAVEENYVSNDVCENGIINENALTLSPCLRKLPKFSHKSNETTLNTTPTSSSDCRTPPYVPKWNVARFSAMKSTGKNNSLDSYNPNCDDTPKIESIGLSKRSFEFFKSLISPKSSKNDSENVNNLSEDSSYNASLEKAPSSLYNKHFSSFASGRASLNGTPTTPLAKKNENNDLQSDSAYVLEEQDSIYADADNETESDLEMKFPMNF